MTSKQARIGLQSAIEAGETYIGGKPRRRNRRAGDSAFPQQTRARNPQTPGNRGR